MRDGHTRLGELLLRRSLIEASGLEAALANQAICGGRLGTNLVELGLIQLDYVGRALSIQLGVPQADWDALNLAEDKVLGLLPAATCNEFKVFPVRRQGGDLHLAMLDPEPSLAEAIGESLQLHVVRYVCPELRMLYFLELRYGLPRPPRFLRVPEDNLSGANPGRRRYLEPTVKTGGSSTFPASSTFKREPTDERLRLRVGPEVSGPRLADRQPASYAKPNTADVVALDQWSAPGAAEAAPSLAPAVTSPTNSPSTDGAIPVIVDPPLSDRAFHRGEALDQAASGSDIAKLMCRPFHPHVVLSVLFWVRGNMAVACHAHDVSLPLSQVQQLVVPLNEPSLLEWAHNLRSPVRAAISEDVLMQRIAEFFDSPPAEEACVMPVLVRGAIVNLVCFYVAQGTVFPETVLQDLTLVAQKAADAYLRLIRRNVH